MLIHWVMNKNNEGYSIKNVIGFLNSPHKKSEELNASYTTVRERTGESEMENV